MAQSQLAVENYKKAQDEVKRELFKEMGSQIPQVIRDVLGRALVGFQDGTVTETEINDILQKNFSDKTFNNMMMCIQGDLEMCKKVKLEAWKYTAEKDIAQKSAIVKERAKREKIQKREAITNKMEKIYAAQSKLTEEERQEQRKLERESKEIEKKIMKAQNMTVSEKMDAFSKMKEELNEKLYELYGGSPPEAALTSQPGVSSVFDFHQDEQGKALLKVKEHKKYSDFLANPDQISQIKDTYSSDRFKFDKVMQMIGENEKPKVEAEKPKEEIKAPETP